MEVSIHPRSEVSLLQDVKGFEWREGVVGEGDRDVASSDLNISNGI